MLPKTLESARVTNIAREKLAGGSRESGCIVDERLGQTAWQAGLTGCLNALETENVPSATDRQSCSISD